MKLSFCPYEKVNREFLTNYKSGTLLREVKGDSVNVSNEGSSNFRVSLEEVENGGAS
jgi:hypothetical protein